MKLANRKYLVMGLIVLAVAGMVVATLSRTPQSPATDPVTAAPRPAMTVTTERAQQTPLPIRLAAYGNIAAWQEASIGSESNGLRLREVLVNVGDVVRAGQLLATFAPETVEADVAQARAALMEAEALAAEAAAVASRSRSLAASGAVSAQQVSQDVTAEQTAQARVAAARATLGAQQLRLKHVRVLAPDSGIISERRATVGAVAGAGTELFRMIRKGRLEWRAEVTAAELGRIRQGMPVHLTATNGTRVEGKVRMIGPTVDVQSRSALVYVDLQPVPDEQAAPKAGMYAHGEFDLGTSSALTVPQAAVVLRDGFSYVFQVGDDGRVTRLKVRTGRRYGERVEILEGMPATAPVVTSGAGFLNDGDLVRVVPAVAGKGTQADPLGRKGNAP